MGEALQGWLADAVPFMIFVATVALFVIVRQLDKVNAYLRYLSVMAYRREGGESGGFQDPGKL